MAFIDSRTGVASTIFVAFYTFYTLVAVIPSRRLGFGSNYGMLFFFGVIRIAGQICALVYSVIGLGGHYSNANWVTAYTILVTESYFVELLVALAIMIEAEMEVHGESKLMLTKRQINQIVAETGKSKTIIILPTFIVIYHLILIPANALVIAGGSLIAGDQNEIDSSEYLTSQVLRIVGQVIFLIQNGVVGLVALWMIYKRGVFTFKIKAVLASFPFLFIRGLYGLVNPCISSIDYFKLQNYFQMTTTFVALEYVLGVTMEAIGAVFLLISYFYKNNNQYGELNDNHDAEKELSSLSEKYRENNNTNPQDT